MHGGKRFNVRGWEAAETGGTQAEAKRHIKLRLWVVLGRQRTVIETFEGTAHPGYNNVSIPQSRIAISKLSLYPERFTKGTSITDSMGSNRNKEDTFITKVD